MNLLARVKADDVGCFSFIDDSEVRETVNNGLFVCLRRTESGLLLVPEELRSMNSTLYVECEERQTNGTSTVVCGLSGKSLKAERDPAFGPRRTDAQAYFFAPLSVVTIECARGSDDVSIVLHQGKRDGVYAFVSEDVLWEGDGNALPRELSRFSAAARAARKKAACPECRHVHFQGG